MLHLEVEDVLAIACEVLKLDAATLVRATKLGLVDSAVARPRSGFGGEEFYSTVEAKAAALLFGLARNHAFIDGNKRIALLSTLQFLNVNGFGLDLSSVEDAYETMAQVASGQISQEGLMSWIQDHLEMGFPCVLE